MYTTRRKRLSILLISGITVAAMLLLSAGLSGLEFLPGQSLPLWGNQTRVIGEFGTLPGGEAMLLLMRMVFILALLCLPLSIIYLIISPEARKRLLKQLLSLLPFVLMFILIAPLLRNCSFQPEETGLSGTGQPAAEPLPRELAVFIPDPPPWLILVASLGLALLLTALIAGSVWLIWRRRRPESPMQRLAQEAQSALDALQSGGDLKNIVIRCYFEMSRVLNEQRGIRRDQDMTPREFERLLAGKGLPAEPVRQLTRLFEDVRYGTQIPGHLEERQALASLTAIVAACRSQA
jgi:hypothetical protein